MRFFIDVLESFTPADRKKIESLYENASSIDTILTNNARVKFHLAFTKLVTSDESSSESDSSVENTNRPGTSKSNNSKSSETKDEKLESAPGVEAQVEYVNHIERLMDFVCNCSEQYPNYGAVRFLLEKFESDLNKIINNKK